MPHHRLIRDPTFPSAVDDDGLMLRESDKSQSEAATSLASW